MVTIPSPKAPGLRTEPRVIVAFNRKAGRFFVHGPKGWTQEKERATIYLDRDLASRSLEEVRPGAPEGTRVRLLPHHVLLNLRYMHDQK